MSISVDCPSCGHKLKAPAQDAGKRTKCPKCGHLISIPGRNTRAAEDQGKLAPSSRQRPPDANPEDLAAALLLGGKAPLAPWWQDMVPPEEAEGKAREAPLPWEPGFEGGQPTQAETPDLRSGKGSKSALLWAMCCVAAAALLTGAFFVYWSHARAETDQHSQEAAAQQKADEERARKEQASHQQQLEQTVREERRRREEAEGRLAKLEDEQKQQAERERTLKEQLTEVAGLWGEEKARGVEKEKQRATDEAARDDVKAADEKARIAIAKAASDQAAEFIRRYMNEGIDMGARTSVARNDALSLLLHIHEAVVNDILTKDEVRKYVANHFEHYSEDEAAALADIIDRAGDYIPPDSTAAALRDPVIVWVTRYERYIPRETKDLVTIKQAWIAFRASLKK